MDGQSPNDSESGQLVIDIVEIDGREQHRHCLLLLVTELHCTTF